MTEKKSEIVKKEESQLTKFESFKSIEEMTQFADVLIKSKLVPDSLKKPEQVVTVILQGKELGFGPLAALNNIHNIQGKASLGVHAIGALLKRNGITWKIIEDGVYVKEDGTTDEIKKPGVSYIDRRTTIEFYEKFHNQIITNKISFTLKEAKEQGLLDKSNWKRMQKIMLRNRTLTLGARFVDPNAVLGTMETSEMADITNADVLLNEEGEVIEIKN